jgi:hypothetical protein
MTTETRHDPLAELSTHVAVWLDLYPELLASGELHSLITGRHVVGVTTNTESHGHRLHRQVPSTRTDGVAVTACCHDDTPGKTAKTLVRNSRG